MYVWGTATSAVDMKGSNHFGGGMFVPSGGVSITGVDSVASAGYIQALSVDYGSGTATFNGTGPCESHAPNGTLQHTPGGYFCVFSDGSRVPATGPSDPCHFTQPGTPGSYDTVISGNPNLDE